jgi:5-methylcytosine-specific restriction endonuclease McrA
MDHQTLVLTPWMAAHRIIGWKQAAFDFVQKKFDVLEEWDEVIRSPNLEFKLPSVVRLLRSPPSYKKGIKFGKINVMTRDNFTCQYCGQRLPMKELNYDHVLPKIQGGKREWENIVASCYRCNGKKGGRTPEEARMKLRRKPYRPRSLPMTIPMWSVKQVPDVWVPYLEACGIQLQKTG